MPLSRWSCSVSGDRPWMQAAPCTPGNVHTHKLKLLQLRHILHYPWPSYKHAHTESQTPPSNKTVTHTNTHPSSPPTPPCHTVPALFLTQKHRLSLCLLLLSHPFAFLSGFMDQRREQLHQRRSGGVEMKRCVAVGEHLAAVRRRGRRGGGDRCAAGSLGRSLWPPSTVRVGGWVVMKCAESQMWEPTWCVPIWESWVCLSRVSDALKQPPITSS